MAIGAAIGAKRAACRVMPEPMSCGAAIPWESEIACGWMEYGEAHGDTAHGDNPKGDTPNDDNPHGFKPNVEIGTTLALAHKAKANMTTTDVNWNEIYIIIIFNQNKNHSFELILTFILDIGFSGYFSYTCVYKAKSKWILIKQTNQSMLL